MNGISNQKQSSMRKYRDYGWLFSEPSFGVATQSFYDALKYVLYIIYLISNKTKPGNVKQCGCSRCLNSVFMAAIPSTPGSNADELNTDVLESESLPIPRQSKQHNTMNGVNHTNNDEVDRWLELPEKFIYGFIVPINNYWRNMYIEHILALIMNGNAALYN